MLLLFTLEASITYNGGIVVENIFFKMCHMIHSKSIEYVNNKVHLFLNLLFFCFVFHQYCPCAFIFLNMEGIPYLEIINYLFH